LGWHFGVWSIPSAAPVIFSIFFFFLVYRQHPARFGLFLPLEILLRAWDGYDTLEFGRIWALCAPPGLNSGISHVYGDISFGFLILPWTAHD
jgi:hypothetical protein